MLIERVLPLNMHRETGQLKPVSPFDFGKSMDALWTFNQMLGEPLPMPNKLVKAITVAGETFGFQVEPGGLTQEPVLNYTIFSPSPLRESLKDVLLYRMSSFLGLEDDLNPFYEAALQDPSFSVVVMRLFGYHPLKFLTPFEAACWAILTQRNLVPLAVKMRHSIIQDYGGGISIEDVSYRAFPEPERLAKVPENDFITCLGDEKRAGQILKAAQAFSTIEESWLLSADFVRVENWLHNLQGIGFSSATMILIQGLGRMEQASYTDKKLLSAVAKVYGKSIAREDVPKLAAQYGKWQGYWASYLSHFSAK